MVILSLDKPNQNMITTTVVLSAMKLMERKAWAPKSSDSDMDMSQNYGPPYLCPPRPGVCLGANKKVSSLLLVNSNISVQLNGGIQNTETGQWSVLTSVNMAGFMDLLQSASAELHISSVSP